MYTNELLEEKYKAQQLLLKESEAAKIDYFDLIQQEVLELFKQNGWVLTFAERKGGYLKEAEQ